jgi:hypothetical protein
MHNMLKNKKILSLLLATLPLVSMAQERAAFGPIENRRTIRTDCHRLRSAVRH